MNTRSNILQWILTKLSTYLILRRVWNRIDFQGHWVKFLPCNILQWILTKLGTYLGESGTLLIFKVKGQCHQVKFLLHNRVSAGFYYTKVKWPNSYKFLWPFVLKGTYSIGQLCPNLPKTYRPFNDILRCGLIHLMQLELNLIFIYFKLAYLLWYLELTTRQVFRGHHLFPKKS